MRRCATNFQFPDEEPPFTNSHGTGTLVRQKKLTDFEKVTVLNYARYFDLPSALTREQFLQRWPNGMHVHPALLDVVDEVRRTVRCPHESAAKKREVSTCTTSVAKAQPTEESSFASTSHRTDAAPGTSPARNPKTEKPGFQAARLCATPNPASTTVPAAPAEHRQDSGFNRNLLDPLLEWHVRCYAMKAAVCGRRKRDEWLGSLGPERERVEPFLVAMDYALDAFERENPRPPKPPLSGDPDVDARRLANDIARMGARVCDLMLEGAKAVQVRALATIRSSEPALFKSSLRALVSVSHLLEDESKTAKRFAEMTIEGTAKRSKRPQTRRSRRS